MIMAQMQKRHVADSVYHRGLEGIVKGTNGDLSQTLLLTTQDINIKCPETVNFRIDISWPIFVRPRMYKC